MKIVKIKLQKNTSIENGFCWILFCASVSISFITWSYIAQSLKSWIILNSRRKLVLKNVQDKNSYCIKSREIAYKKRVKSFAGHPVFRTTKIGIFPETRTQHQIDFTLLHPTKSLSCLSFSFICFTLFTVFTLCIHLILFVLIILFICCPLSWYILCNAVDCSFCLGFVKQFHNHSIYFMTLTFQAKQMFRIWEMLDYFASFWPSLAKQHQLKMN